MNPPIFWMLSVFSILRCISGFFLGSWRRCSPFGRYSHRWERGRDSEAFRYDDRVGEGYARHCLDYGGGRWPILPVFVDNLSYFGPVACNLSLALNAELSYGRVVAHRKDERCLSCRFVFLFDADDVNVDCYLNLGGKLGFRSPVALPGYIRNLNSNSQQRKIKQQYGFVSIIVCLLVEALSRGRQQTS